MNYKLEYPIGIPIEFYRSIESLSLARRLHVCSRSRKQAVFYGPS